MKTKITLRSKSIKGGKKSLYLDFYPAIQLPNGKSTRREFLKLWVYDKPANATERLHNTETKSQAEHITAQRKIQLQQNLTGYIGSATKKEDFLAYVEKLAKEESLRLDRLGGKSSMLNILKKYQPVIKVSDVTRDFCEGFKSYLAGQDIASSSASIYFKHFKACCSKGVRDRMFASNPANGVEHIKPKKSAKIEYLTASELKMFRKFKTVEKLVKAAFLFGCYTGLRHSDIMRLDWGHVIERGGGLTIELDMQKTGHTVEIPVGKKALKLMGERKTGKVFAGLNYSYVAKRIEKLIKAAGIDKKITFHCSRHTFATLLISKGADIYTVSKLLGHTSVKQTEKYAKVVSKKKSKAISLLDGI